MRPVKTMIRGDDSKGTAERFIITILAKHDIMMTIIMAVIVIITETAIVFKLF